MQAVIIAAGESSRFWPLNQKHKSLIKIMGRPLIWHTIESLKKAGIEEIIIVQGPKRDVEEELKNYKLKVKYVVQKKPKSTGDAVWQVRDLIKETFIVSGPHKIDLNNYLPKLLKKSKQNPQKIILLGVKTINSWDYGILKFKGDKIIRIIENPPKGKEPSDVKAAETYIFPKEFFNYYKKVPQKEENLIDAINLFIKEKGAEFVLLKEDTISLKYPWHLFRILKMMFELKKFKHYISPSAIIGKNVVIKGKVYIGDKVVIGENTVISGPCYIGDNCKIGASNVFRGPVNLEKDIVMGSFAEIKNCFMQKGTHLHSGYFGDSVIGENCRFGAGFITANRRIDRQTIKSIIKGKKIDTDLTYFGTVVGDNSRFGVHSGTMPGVLIGSNCTIWPGTLVFKNIENNTTLFTEFKNTKKK